MGAAAAAAGVTSPRSSPYRPASASASATSPSGLPANASATLSPPTSSRRAPQLSPSNDIFDPEATAIINSALSAPPHLKHHLRLDFPTPTPLVAQNLVRVLSVDKPLRPDDTSLVYSSIGAAVRVELRASTVRVLRLTANSVLEDVSLVLKTIADFPGRGSGSGSGSGGGTGMSGIAASGVAMGETTTATAVSPQDSTQGDPLEEGTVGRVERIVPSVSTLAPTSS